MNENDTNPGGAARLLTPESTLRAIQLVNTGRVLPLGQSFGESMPQLADCPGRGPFETLPPPGLLVAHAARAWAARGLESGPRIASEWLELSTHSGTHIDALGHWSTRGHQFGGIAVDENWSETGVAELGLEHCPPIVTRGILLDVAGVREVERMAGGDLIYPDDLERAAAWAGVEVGPADVALVRTGWAQWWGESAREYMGAAPGLTRAAANWLADRQVVAIGADTWPVDAVPPENPREQRAVHEVCLVERGVHLIENLNLEDLSRERAYAFLFICLTPRFVGGTGFPVMPVAVL